MGFSLDNFFNELFAVLASNAGEKEKLIRLDRLIAEEHVYAFECGKLRKDK